MASLIDQTLSIEKKVQSSIEASYAAAAVVVAYLILYFEHQNY